MYLGLRKLINPQPSAVSKEAYVADERRDTDTDKLFEAFAVLEDALFVAQRQRRGLHQKG